MKFIRAKNYLANWGDAYSALTNNAKECWRDMPQWHARLGIILGIGVLGIFMFFTCLIGVRPE